jgi:integrase
VNRASRNDTSGIDSRPTRDGTVQYRGRAWDKRTNRNIVGQWGPSEEEARAWRDRARVDIRSGKMSTGIVPRLSTAVDVFLEGIESGTVFNESGRPFKPSVVRGYRTSLRRAVIWFGAVRLDKLVLKDLQLYVDARNHEVMPSTVRNDIVALRSVYAWARLRHDGLAERDPFRGLRFASGEKKRDRIAPPEKLALLIAALAPSDRAVLALAAYAGLRSGEVFALAREHVDLERRRIYVRRAWDPGSGGAFVGPKTKKGVRDVPIVTRLAVILEDHLAGMPPDRELLFAGSRSTRGRAASSRPMCGHAFMRRARKRWDLLGLDPIGLHESRHTYASMSIAAGVNAKSLSTYMGHSSIVMTNDRYGHLFPGNEDEALELLNAYLERDVEDV